MAKKLGGGVQRSKETYHDQFPRWVKGEQPLPPTLPFPPEEHSGVPSAGLTVADCGKVIRGRFCEHADKIVPTVYPCSISFVFQELRLIMFFFFFCFLLCVLVEYAGSSVWSQAVVS